MTNEHTERFSSLAVNVCNVFLLYLINTPLANSHYNQLELEAESHTQAMTLKWEVLSLLCCAA